MSWENIHNANAGGVDFEKLFNHDFSSAIKSEVKANQNYAKETIDDPNFTFTNLLKYATEHAPVGTNDPPIIVVKKILKNIQNALDISVDKRFRILNPNVEAKTPLYSEDFVRRICKIRDLQMDGYLFMKANNSDYSEESFITMKLHFLSRSLDLEHQRISYLLKCDKSFLNFGELFKQTTSNLISYGECINEYYQVFRSKRFATNLDKRIEEILILCSNYFAELGTVYKMFILTLHQSNLVENFPKMFRDISADFPQNSGNLVRQVLFEMLPVIIFRPNIPPKFYETMISNINLSLNLAKETYRITTELWDEQDNPNVSADHSLFLFLRTIELCIIGDSVGALLPSQNKALQSPVQQIKDMIIQIINFNIEDPSQSTKERIWESMTLKNFQNYRLKSILADLSKHPNFYNIFSNSIDFINLIIKLFDKGYAEHGKNFSKKKRKK